MMNPFRRLVIVIGLAGQMWLLLGCHGLFESERAHQHSTVQLYQQENDDGAIAESGAALRIDPYVLITPKECRANQEEKWASRRARRRKASLLLN
jgi:hypothetical protein